MVRSKGRHHRPVTKVQAVMAALASVLLVVGMGSVVALMTAVPAAAVGTPFAVHTSFAIDGDKTGTNDWTTLSTIGPYTTDQGHKSSGIVSSASGRDACTPTATDGSGFPGSQTQDTDPWVPGAASPNKKADLCSGQAAIEVVDVGGVFHYIYYANWTRSPDASGDLTVFANLEGPLAGRGDDRLVSFDYNPNNQTATVTVLSWNGTSWVGGAGLPATQFAYAVGRNTETADGGNSAAAEATFAEIAIDLTAAGVLPSDSCQTFSAASSISRTGNSSTAQLQDFLTYSTALTLRSCNTLTISKAVEPATATGGPFGYIVSRTGAEGVHDSTLTGDTGEADQDATNKTITQTLTVPGDTSDTWTNVLTGSDFLVKEPTVPAGWALKDISCTYYDVFEPVAANRTKTVSLYQNGAYTGTTFHIPSSTLGPGSSCRITNQTSTLRIAKTGQGDTNAAFSFAVTGQQAQSLRLGQTTAPMMFTPGTPVTITESFPTTAGAPPWNLTKLVCVNDADPTVPIGTIDLTARTATVTTIGGANITCTYTNEQQAQIRIRKRIQPTNATKTFGFTWGTGVAGASTETLGDGQTSAFYTVAPGTYTATEAADTDFSLAAIQCDDTDSGEDTLATRTARFAVAAGESITCTFINVPNGSLTIIKDAVPNAGQDFGFTTTEPAGGTSLADTFTLDDDGGTDPTYNSSRSWTGLPTGTYTVTEGSTAGWDLTGLVCTDQVGNNTTTSLATRTATIQMDAADTVICTFTNTRKSAKLTLTKSWVQPVPLDEVQLTTTGDVNTATINGLSIATSATGGATTTPAVRTIYAGENVTLGEQFLVADSTYTASLACYADADGDGVADNTTKLTGLTYTAGALSGQFLVDNDPIGVVCVFTNDSDTATLRLHKNWLDSPLGGAVDLTITGLLGSNTASNANTTGTGTIANPDEGSGGVAELQVVVGRSPRLSEAFTQGLAVQYITNLTCSSIVDGQPTAHVVDYSTGNTFGTVLIKPEDKDSVIDCWFTNERRRALVSFVKAWGYGAPGDTAALSFSGLAGDFSKTSTVPQIGGTPPWAATYFDLPNALTTPIYGGELIDFGETLGAANIGTYQSQIICRNEADIEVITIPPGVRQLTDFKVPDTLAALGSDTDGDGNIEVTCFVTNLRDQADVFVQKAWTNAVAGDTATLTATEQLSKGTDTATSTATGAPGTLVDTWTPNGTVCDPVTDTQPCGLPDYVNVAHVDTFTGSQVLIKEVVAPDTRYTNATPVCAYTSATGNGNAVVTPTANAREYLVTVPLNPGAQITCTYDNVAPRGTIVVVKSVQGADGTFDFDRNWSATDGTPSNTAIRFSMTTANKTVTQTYTGVLAGQYTVSEIDDTAGFDFTSLICTDSNGTGTASTVDGLTGTINLEGGETVTCTFTNTQKANLVVIKDAVPNDDQDFAFTTTSTATGAEIAEPLPAFSLDDDADATLSNTASGQVAANKAYTIAEAATPGWTVGAASQCSGTFAAGATPVTIPASGSVSVTPAPGGTVTCTFVNEAAPSTLNLTKTAANVPAGQAWSFTLGLSPHTPATYVLAGTGTSSASVTVNDLVLNTQYTLTDPDVVGWTEGAFTCTGLTDEDAAAPGFQFTVTSPAMTINCSVTNTAVLPKLTLQKTVVNTGTGATAVPSDWTLTATGPTPGVSGTMGSTAVTAANVAPGSYALTEAANSAAIDAMYAAGSTWLCDVTRADGTVENDVLGNTVTLALGDEGTCGIVNTAIPGTFTYTKSVDIDGDPATNDDGKTVEPGDTVTYTVTVNHTGGAPITGVVITDGLTDVLDNATLGTITPSAGTANLVGSDIVWNVGTVSPGAPLTMTYTATVKPDQWDAHLVNVVTSSTPGGGCAVDCITDNPTPAWTLTKTADPVTGSTVKPGDEITYTLEVTNTSDALVTGKVITDDLWDVLDNATLTKVNGGAVDPADPATFPAGITFAGTTLTWAVPDLAAAPMGEADTKVSITYTVVVNADQWGQKLANVVTPTPTSGGCQGDCAPSTEHFSPSYRLVKSSTPDSGTMVSAGDTVEYQLTVTNTGEVPLVGAVVTDDISDVVDNATLVTPLDATLTRTGDTLSWAVPTLPVGGQATVTYAVTVNAGNSNATLANVATPGPGGQCPWVPAFAAAAAADEACDTAHPVRSWTLAKSSDPVSGTVVAAGQDVTYTLTVTNTSPVELTGATVTDDLSAVLDKATLKGALPVGATLTGTTLTWTVPTVAVGSTATYSYTVTVKAGVTGALQNLAAPGTDGSCPQLCTTDHPIRSWTLSKSSAPPSGSTVAPGSDVTYTLTVANTGPAALVGATVTDDLSAVLDKATLKGAPPAGATMAGTTLTWAVPDVPADSTVTLSYTVTVKAGATGALKNLAAPGTDGSCLISCTTDHPIRSWTLAKSSNPATGTIVAAGQDVTYTLTVTNTGSSSLTGATVTDDLSAVLDKADLVGTLPTGATLTGTALTWTVPSVAAGATATLSYTVKVKSGVTGALRNLAAPGTDGSCVESCTTDHPIRSWTLAKTSNPVTGSVVAAGQDVTYTLTVTNTGQAPLTDATVTDDLSAVLDKATLKGALPAGATLTGTTLTWAVPSVAVGATATVSYTVTVKAGVTGALRNLAAPGTDGSCVVSCTTDHPIRSWTLAKTSDPVSGSTVSRGQDVTYTLTVTNTGPAQLTGATVTDDLSDVLDNATMVGALPTAAKLSGTTLTWTVPAVAAGATATLSYTVKVKAVTSGTLRNLAVPGTDGSCVQSCTTDHEVSSWTLAKTSNPATGTSVSAGQDVVYTLTVTNLAATPLTGATVSDDLSAVLDKATLVGALPAGAALSGTTLTWTVPSVAGKATTTLSYTVKVKADAQGALRNLAAPSSGGECPDACTTDHPVSSWTLTKTSNPVTGTKVKTGDTITYFLTVTNTGADVVKGIVATDDVSGLVGKADILQGTFTAGQGTATLTGTTLVWTVGDLAVGAKQVFSYQVLVKASAEGSSLKNVVAPTGGIPPSSCDPCSTDHPVPAVPVLAFTGAEVTGMVRWALTLLTVGGFLVVIGRRRREGADA